jgi:L-lysine exporter family protein LysE/ArgO
VFTTDRLTVFLAGLAFGLSLIAVLGPQNLMVIRVGLRRRGLGAVVTVCVLSDVILVLAGTAGAGAALRRAHWLMSVVRYAGAAFLLTYALLALRRAVRPQPAAADPMPDATGLAGPSKGGVRATSVAPAGVGVAVLSASALTWLNPGVYLDTVVLVGSVAHSHAPDEWWFAAGAGAASVLWFVALGFAARRLGPRLDRPATWRAVDALVVVVMTVTAIRLLS